MLNGKKCEVLVHQCNGQATVEIPLSTRFTLLFLVRSCLFEVLLDCAKHFINPSIRHNTHYARIL